MATTKQIEAVLLAVFETAMWTDDEMQHLVLSETESTVRAVRTFEDAGLLGSDRGVVVKLEDGSEFQISVVCSAR